MTATRRPRSARAARRDGTTSPVTGTYTGVASGGLGTGANLEDTQVYDVDDLRLPELAPEPPPVVAHVPDPVVQPVDRPTARVASPARVHATRRLGSGTLAAGVLVGVGAVAVLAAVAGGESRLGAGTGTSQPTVGATVAPVTAEPDTAGNGGGGGGGKGDGGGKGGGKGHGKGDGGGKGH